MIKSSSIGLCHTLLSAYKLSGTGRILLPSVQLATLKPNPCSRLTGRYIHRSTMRYNEQVVPEVAYDVVSLGVKDRSLLLLDVRTAAEVADGIIPGAKAVPVEELDDALKYDNTTFERKYGFKKPSVNEKIVTYCRSGVRSMKAGILLSRHSYTNVSSYKGSWLEWSEKHPEHILSSDRKLK